MNTADKINLAIAIVSGLSAVASSAVCLATFRILKATQDTLAATKAQMFAARRPYIEIGVTIDAEQPVLTLTIRNSGSSAAERVRLTMDHDFLFNGEADGDNIRDYPIFKTGVDSVPSRAEIKLMLGVGHSVFSHPGRCPPKFKVAAHYFFDGIEFLEASSIDLDAFRRHSVATSPSAKALDKIADAAQAIAAQLKR